MRATAELLACFESIGAYHSVWEEELEE